ncbi:MAG: RNase adapter RapZ [Selenomonadaceae bacterium]|nr:RNase adapter RapZ [Selenomonadaceae bacterium]
MENDIQTAEEKIQSDESENQEKISEDTRIIIVTGMSGSGKTQACRFLEDLGYFCVDNLPPVFVPKFVELCSHASTHVSRIVLVIDTRSREFFDNLIQVLEEMDKNDQDYEMLFMDASDDAIIRRYKETRRRHPMAPSSRISDGVAKERKRLEDVRSKATYIIDTSNLAKAELREKIRQLFAKKEGTGMNISVLSFGFKFGMPLDADMVLDVRFLPNPFYIEALKHKSGSVPEVSAYISEKTVTQDFLKKLDPFIDFLIPQYVREGKSQLVIAVGCTGGMHRSVFTAKHIFDNLVKKGFTVNLEHRDLMKNDVWEV